MRGVFSLVVRWPLISQSGPPSHLHPHPRPPSFVESRPPIVVLPATVKWVDKVQGP